MPERGSFLDDVAGFDAAFFGMSPREATSVDPQQRILLEVVWEALEHAGIPAESLKGSDTGVFVAGSAFDYGQRLQSDPALMEPWALHGSMLYALANRVSYTLDLRGPSLVVDTACASSLTALHLACQSLWRQESSVALACGVNVMAAPGAFIGLTSSGALSPGGVSKAYDEAADGYGRGEGAVVVALKPLEAALRAGDRVLALVRGTAIAQHGHTDGMISPSESAQADMLRSFYARVGVAPRTVDYVEGHGVGTPVGDRVEANALSEVLGAGRGPDDPCYLGSLKPNFGHLEAGAGLAGVAKTVLALWHSHVPQTLFDRPNPEIRWAGLRLAGENMPWPDRGGVRRAAVSSFGAGGVIAHALLEQAPAAPDAPDEEPDGSVIVALSAATTAALAESAANLLAWIRAQPEVSVRSLAHTLARRRSHLPVRAAIVADSIAQVEAGLQAVVSDEPTPGTVIAEVDSGDRAGAVWVFSGHGAQWDGMARRLLSREPVFAAVIDGVAEIYRDELGFSAREAIEAGDWSSVLRVQAMTFALQVALAEVLRDRGAAPAAIIGHSVGEIAASVVAGVLPLADAARFACRRAALLQRLAGQGSMALVGLPFAEVDRQLAGRDDVVAAIAASAITSVVSGATAAVDEVVTAWEASEIMVRRVASDGAFHSPQIDPILPELAEAAARLVSSPATVPLYSSALEDPRSPAPRDARYWVTNARRPVLFDQAVRAAVADGHRVFLEVSTHPIVTHSITETLDSLGIDPPLVTGTLRRGEDEDAMIMAAIAWLHCHGDRIDWNAAAPAGNLLSLPTMPWQHRSYWLPAPSTAGRAARHDPARHSLLGGRSVVGGESPTRMWQTELDLPSRPYAGEHRVFDAEIVPASVLLNTLLQTDAEQRATRGLRDIRLRVPVQVVPRTVQVLAGPDGLSISSRIQGGDDLADGWMVHTTAVFDESVEPITGNLADTAAIRARCGERWPWAQVEDHYRRRGATGFGFPWHVDEVDRGPLELIADLHLTSAAGGPAPTWAGALDAAMSMTPLLMPDDGVLRMPAAIERVRVRDEPTRQVTVHAVVRESATDTVDLRISDADGRVTAEVRGLRFGKLEGGSAAARPGQLVYSPQWQPYVAESAPEARREILVVSEHAERGEKLAAAFVAAGFPSSWAPAVPERFAESAVVLLLPAIPAPDEPVDRAAEACTWSLISAAKQLAQSSAPARLWCVTQGVRAAADRAALAHAPLWGAARIMAGELPQLFAGLADLDSDNAFRDPEIAARLAGLVQTEPADEIVSVREDGVQVLRLAHPAPATNRPAIRCHAGGTYLITGGTGALGLETARWLIQRGARRLVLAARHGLPPRNAWSTTSDPATLHQIDAVRKLEELGATVRVIALDIGDRDQAALALAPETLDMPPIRGVVHAAGSLRDALVERCDRSTLAAALHAKVTGAVVLDQLFPPGSLDFLVLFSSVGSYARITGQVTYAAGNTFLDALATHRNNGGFHDTYSLAWTAWDGAGMNTALPAGIIELNDRGIGAISAAEAFPAWEYAHRLQTPNPVIVRALPTRAPSGPPVLSELHDSVAGSEDNADAAISTTDLSTLPADELRTRLIAEVREQTGAELGMAVTDVGVTHALTAMGMDSVMSVALRLRLRRRYGVELPPTILWKQPTVTALADHIAEQILGAAVQDAH